MTVFDRLDDRTGDVVDSAQVVARWRGARRVAAHDLLAGLLAGPDAAGRAVLGRLDVRPDDLQAGLALVAGGRPLPDADALAALGIDLDEVRRRVEDAFGPGALDRTRAARAASGPVRQLRIDRSTRTVLELAVREALRLGHAHVGCEHLLLGMLHPDAGAVHDLLVGHGVRLVPARAAVEEVALRRRAG